MEQNPCKEINLGDKTEVVAEKHIIEVIGQISQKDLDDGTVLIFRIDDRKYSSAVLNRVAESIKKACIDTFQGQIKAMILPSSIEVQILRDILNHSIKQGEDNE